MHPYDFKTIEPAIVDFWKDREIYEKCVQKNKGKKRFYYLDGPPYTTGQIHIGHAWGKALRDAILRYKRMRGFDVWDRPGFDMHGLPIEVKVEKKLGIKQKKEIIENIGLAKFTEECEKYALENLWPMVKDFMRIGVWMNWQNPYMTIRNEYIEGAWWALANAHKNGYLYLGKKSMTWCPQCETALAKHELEYENRTDDSIYVKFKLQDKPNEYLVIWTTTPWTIPFNMAVMVHPDIEYVKVKTKEEVWIVAKERVDDVFKKAGKSFEIVETVKGKDLAGLKYHHVFKEEVPFHQEQDAEKACTVLLSKEFVSVDDGSGLVHCAPGCGPEDFEIGKQNNIPPFNECDEHGVYREAMGSLKGLVAKQDDYKFIQLLEDKGALVAKTKIQHEYAHCWRSKTPIIYRATDQWFLATEKLKDKMVKENKSVDWVPEWAGNRWFDSWLSSLQDWCISRQRFWGIPLPIWTCECGKQKVIGTREELKKASGQELENVHRPWIDEVTIKCECGSIMHRVPDVLDVWLDSGCAPWATLNYPDDKKTFEEFGFPDLILEGKDQIRGWFNSLMCMSMVSTGKVPYKAVYMHGFINDAQGRKMSKSLGNVISPYEITDAYGADTLRYYQIGGAQPGLDLNFNHDDAKIKHKNLIVLWNVQKFMVDLAEELGKNPAELAFNDVKKHVHREEKYILSKVNSTIKKVTELFDTYHLNEVPGVIEECFLSLSRDYIQMVREKAAVGDDEDKTAVLYTIYTSLSAITTMFAPITPFICEQLHQHLKEKFNLSEESVHLRDWPVADEAFIDEELEALMTAAGLVVQGILAAREKAKLSVRWPVTQVKILSQDPVVLKAAEKLEETIKYQTNVKVVIAKDDLDEVSISAKGNPGTLGKEFGKKSPAVLQAVSNADGNKIMRALATKGRIDVQVEEETITLTKDHITIERQVSGDLVEAEFRAGFVYLDTSRTDELDAEGFAREIMRRVQQLRKDAGLKKTDTAEAHVKGSAQLIDMIAPWKERIEEKCGARVELSEEAPKKKFERSSEEKIKDKEVTLFVRKA